MLIKKKGVVVCLKMPKLKTGFFSVNISILVYTRLDEAGNSDYCILACSVTRGEAINQSIRGVMVSALALCWERPGSIPDRVKNLNTFL